MVYLIIFGIIVIGFIGLRIGVGLVSPMPSELGVKEGQLTDCPRSPNCVSTQATRDRQLIAPLPLNGDLAGSRQKILEVVNGMPRTKIIANEPNYVHAEFRTLVWGFIDDVEFYFDEERDLIQVRSASRLGESDLGVNRQRVEVLRAAFEG